jgi:hypothetical protein
MKNKSQNFGNIIIGVLLFVIITSVAYAFLSFLASESGESNQVPGISSGSVSSVENCLVTDLSSSYSQKLYYKIVSSCGDFMTNETTYRQVIIGERYDFTVSGSDELYARIKS